MIFVNEMQALRAEVASKLDRARDSSALPLGSEQLAACRGEILAYIRVLDALDNYVRAGAEQVASEALSDKKPEPAIEGRCLRCGQCTWLEEMTVVVSGARFKERRIMMRVCDSCRGEQLVAIDHAMSNWFHERRKGSAG